MAKAGLSVISAPICHFLCSVSPVHALAALPNRKSALLISRSAASIIIFAWLAEIQRVEICSCLWRAQAPGRGAASAFHEFPPSPSDEPLPLPGHGGRGRGSPADAGPHAATLGAHGGIGVRRHSDSDISAESPALWWAPALCWGYAVATLLHVE